MLGAFGGRNDRRSIRLRYFDYRRAGAYFVTICSYERAPLFGSVVSGAVRLSEIGEVVRRCWSEIPLHFPNVTLDQSIIMPDHVHGIIVIRGDRSQRPSLAVPRSFGGAISGSLSAIMGVFKSNVTKQVMIIAGIRRVWQRNYYESVIRNRDHLEAVRKYIMLNPRRWHDPGFRNRSGSRNT